MNEFGASMAANQPEDEYVLGTDADELRRLERQHLAWVEQMYALLSRSGLGRGDEVLDLGSGPGFTAFELAHFVGHRGRVLGCDVSSRFVAALCEEATRRGLDQVEGRVCAAENLGLDDNSLDAVYGRWILSWLPDSSVVFEQVARALRPGGAYLLQEYLDWDTMRLLPRQPRFDRGVAACMHGWDVGGGVINVAEEVPKMAAAVGLEVEYFQVVARSGRPGSLVWCWLDDFYRGYLPRLKGRGLISPQSMNEFLETWETQAQSPSSLVIAPTMADIILRKPKS